jgi:uncharacterized membrane protein YhaH (DUF805 family)
MGNRQAAIEQMKRNLSQALLGSLLRGISTVLWPITFPFYLAIIAWKSRSLWFSFEGRASRKMYWLTLFLYFAWAITTAIIRSIILEQFQGKQTNEGVSQFVYYTTLIAVVGPIIASAAAIGVKRLHDINKSGWWLLLFYSFPAAFIGIGMLNLIAMPQDIQAVLTVFLFLPLTVWTFIELGCRRGTRGPNKYGVDPDQTSVLSTPPAH